MKEVRGIIPAPRTRALLVGELRDSIRRAIVVVVVVLPVVRRLLVVDLVSSLLLSLSLHCLLIEAKVTAAPCATRQRAHDISLLSKLYAHVCLVDDLSWRSIF